jgi:hypothetical protein
MAAQEVALPAPLRLRSLGRVALPIVSLRFFGVFEQPLLVFFNLRRFVLLTPQLSWSAIRVKFYPKPGRNYLGDQETKVRYVESGTAFTF